MSEIEYLDRVSEKVFKLELSSDDEGNQRALAILKYLAGKTADLNTRFADKNTKQASPMLRRNASILRSIADQLPDYRFDGVPQEYRREVDVVMQVLDEV
jgi:hypothetical protein